MNRREAWRVGVVAGWMVVPLFCPAEIVKSKIIDDGGRGPHDAIASKESLKTLQGPVVYIVGGPSDIAYSSARLDYDRIDRVPVAFASLDVGHGGTFAEAFGGPFARLALSWLDWQLKGTDDRASVFLDPNLEASPGWTMKAKNLKGASTEKVAAQTSLDTKVLRDIPYRQGDSDTWKLDMATPQVLTLP